MNLVNIKNQFPIFSKKINNKNLIYLDSSNSSQKPKLVIDRLVLDKKHLEKNN